MVPIRQLKGNKLSAKQSNALDLAPSNPELCARRLSNAKPYISYADSIWTCRLYKLSVIVCQVHRSRLADESKRPSFTHSFQ